jgi:nucleotide-binding universal stress UspA family protein
MLSIRQILHPTDFSGPSDYAFRLACALARDYGAALIVLHVHHEPVAVFAEGGFVPPRPEDDAVLRSQLEEIRCDDPTVVVSHRLVEGNPPEEILRSADELGADLIVMGTHGRRGLQRLLMGSVAEEVVRKATCPVLTVRMPFPREREALVEETEELIRA